MQPHWPLLRAYALRLWVKAAFSSINFSWLVVAAFSGLNRRSFLILSESLLSLWPFPYSIYLDTSTIASLLLKPCSAYIQPFWPVKAVKASIATRWNSGCVGCFWQCSLLLGKACSLAVVWRLKAYFGLYCIKHVQYSEHTWNPRCTIFLGCVQLWATSYSYV